jgi:hypothetical protein
MHSVWSRSAGVDVARAAGSAGAGDTAAAALRDHRADTTKWRAIAPRSRGHRPGLWCGGLHDHDDCGMDARSAPFAAQPTVAACLHRRTDDRRTSGLSAEHGPGGTPCTTTGEHYRDESIFGVAGRRAVARGRSRVEMGGVVTCASVCDAGWPCSVRAGYSCSYPSSDRAG